MKPVYSILFLITVFFIPINRSAATQADITEIEYLIELAGIDVAVHRSSISMHKYFVKNVLSQDRIKSLKNSVMLSLISPNFNKDALLSDMKPYMLENLSLEDIENVLVWLESDLGRRITAIESTEPEQPVDREYIIDVMENNRYRVELLRDLDFFTGTTESSIDRLESMTEIAIQVALSLIPEDDPRYRKLQKTSDSRPDLSGYFIARQDVNLKGGIWVYRELSDEELEKYVHFAQTNESQQYHLVVRDAINHAFDLATEKTVKLAVEFVREARELKTELEGQGQE